MKNNIICKILSSMLLILIMLYFIPFLGICLLLFRYFMYNEKKRIGTSIIIVLIGVLIIIPKIFSLIFNVIELDNDIVMYLNNIINSEIYSINLTNYSKLLICVGIISLVLLYVGKIIINKINSKVNNGIIKYIDKNEERNREIAKENDLEIRIKQEKAKNTGYVKCPNCGSDNLIGDKFGTCKYCRSKLINKNYK